MLQLVSGPRIRTPYCDARLAVNVHLSKLRRFIKPPRRNRVNDDEEFLENTHESRETKTEVPLIYKTPYISLE
jgi:hypothetical protein